MHAIDRLRNRRNWSTAAWVFATHVAVYLAVNAGLLAINLLTGFPPFWFLFPLWGWGILLAGHAGYLVAPHGLVGTDIGLFVVTISGLTVIDFVYSSSRWFYWPLLVWGAVVVIHLGGERTVRANEVRAADYPRPIGSTSRVLMSLLLSLSLVSVVVLIVSGARNGLAVNGSGHVASETRSLAPFTAIDLHGIGTLSVTLGPTPAITITGDDNVVPHIETRVTNQTLTIDLKSSWYHDITPKLGPKYHVTVPNLSAVTLHDATSGELPALRGDQLAVDLHDASKMTVEQVTTPRLTVSLADAAQLTIHGGAVDQLTLHAGDAARADLGGMVARTATVTTDGVAKVTVHATQELAATASEVSQIRYLGSPRITRRETSDLGRIESASP